MQIQPVIAALRRHKSGAVLIGVQIALTLAIICNALFIIHQRLQYLSRPSGMDENNLFVFDNYWVGHGDEEVPALAAADLDAIRSSPEVESAFRSNSYPLRGGGWSTGVVLKRDQQQRSAQTTVYFADEQALQTLGVKLIAGRNFTHDEIRQKSQTGPVNVPVAIVTRALAEKLFPGGDQGRNALGRSIFIENDQPPVVIVGIIEALQTPWVDGAGFDDFAANVTLVPMQPPRGGYFVVRTRPGQLEAAMKAVPERLFALHRDRLILHVKRFTEVRAKAYQSDRGMAILMAIICVALLLVTAAGIVGLASFWVSQRQRQIGVRRALGATRTDILHYFQLENLVISSGGVVIGTIAAIGLNLWLVTQFEMARLPVLFVVLAGSMVLALGQLAVLQPALRASRVPPVIATRSV